MRSIVKISFVLFTCGCVHHATWAQAQGPSAAPRGPAFGKDFNTQAKRNVQKADAKITPKTGPDIIAVGKADADKTKAKAHAKAVKAKAASTSASSGASGSSSHTDDNGVDPCTINKNLPECHNAPADSGG